MGREEKKMTEEVDELIKELLNKRPPLIDEEGNRIPTPGPGHYTVSWSNMYEFGRFWHGAEANWRRQLKMAKLLKDLIEEKKNES